jgi:hypothetical protein
VLIESTENVRSVQPVLEPRVSVELLRPLTLEQVVAVDASAFGAITAQSRVALLGVGLATAGIEVLLDGVALPPSFALQSERRLELDLPATLTAGAHALQVSRVSATAQRRGAESLPIAFLLRPHIAGSVTKTVTTGAGGQLSGQLSVPVVPDVGTAQRVELLLQEKTAPSGQSRRASVLPRLSDPAAVSSLRFPFNGLVAGTYAARLRVDGADSSPVVLGDRSLGPEITLP